MPGKAATKQGQSRIKRRKRRKNIDIFNPKFSRKEICLFQDGWPFKFVKLSTGLTIVDFWLWWYLLSMKAEMIQVPVGEIKYPRNRWFTVLGGEGLGDNGRCEIRPEEANQCLGLRGGRGRGWGWGRGRSVLGFKGEEMDGEETLVHAYSTLFSL